MAAQTQSRYKYVVVESNNFSSVLSPLKSTQRIKYTCFEVSQNFIIFGATSGGLYIFKREPCHFLHLVPNKEGQVDNVCVSPNEKLIAFSTVRGIACVLEHNDDGTKIINRSLEHNGSHITALAWADTSNQLFVADDIGRLSVINVSLFMSKNIFQLPAYIFMKLDSGVSQVCCKGDILLVSTQTRCYICDTTKEQYKQIGSKLRDGDYGACFLNCPPDHIKVFCARPGSRLWEVDLDGTVLSTHQFKRALATQPTPLVSLEKNELYMCSQNSWPEQSINFSHLSTILNKYIFSFKSDGIYIFDPEKVDVVLWSNHYKDIFDAKCINDTVYIWTSNSELHSLVITPVEKCLLRLYFREYYQLCLTVCEKFVDIIRFSEDLSKLTPLVGLRERLPHFNGSDRLQSFLHQLTAHVNGKQSTTKLDSGIFLVENRHLKWKQTEKELYEVNCEDSRSQSLPPETSHLKERNSNSIRSSALNSNSSSSLPDLNHFSNTSDASTNEKCNTHTVENDDNVTMKPLMNGKDHSLITDLNYEEFVFPQIPFFSFTSPDVIQNAIIELGQSVSGKLYNSTKTLKSKWQVLEGKFNIFKCDNHQVDCNKPINYQDTYFECHLKNLEDEIVAGRKKYSPKIGEKPVIDVSQLIEICEDFEKLENGKKADVIIPLLECIIKVNNDYKEKNLVNESKNNFKKVFPFSQCLTTKNILVVQKIFHDGLKSGKMVKCLYKLQTDQEILCSSHITHPEILQTLHSEAELRIDCILSNLLFIFSEIIDPFTIFECLDASKLPCTFASWSIILEIFQESAFNYLTGNSDADVGYTDWPLPLLLNVIFLMFRLDQIESSSQMVVDGHVKLRNISYLILKLALHLETTGMKKEQCLINCGSLFLNFVLKLIEKRSLIIKDLEDSEFLNHLEIVLIESISHTFLMCKCGFISDRNSISYKKYLPIGKFLINFYLCNNESSYSEEQDAGIDSPINNFHGKELLQDFHNTNSIETHSSIPNHWLADSQMQKMFFKHLNSMENVNNELNPSKMCKMVKLLRVMPDLILIVFQSVSCSIKDTLPFIIQFGNISDLDTFVDKGSTAFWENVCNLYVKLSEGECCICHHPFNVEGLDLNWNVLSIMILKSLGPFETLTLLKKFAPDIPSRKLDVSFYRACLLSGLIYSETSEFNSSLIEAYCKTITRQPISGQKSEDTPFITWEADSTDGHTPEIVHSKDRKNWGITLDLDVDACARCSLILNSEKLIQDGGLRAFKCGHAYHVVCLRLCQSLFICPVCT